MRLVFLSIWPPVHGSEACFLYSCSIIDVSIGYVEDFFFFFFASVLLSEHCCLPLPVSDYFCHRNWSLDFFLTHSLLESRLLIATSLRCKIVLVCLSLPLLTVIIFDVVCFSVIVFLFASFYSMLRFLLTAVDSLFTTVYC